jgi:hypothetical protein
MTTAPDAPPRPLSPNSVLANALLRSIDMIRPKVVAARPRRIVFVVGTQVNGAPHLGTSIVQTSAFLLARLARRAFSVDTAVRFSALDNAPYEVTLDPETHRAYQITYFHALGEDGVDELIDRYYRALFDSLSDATDTDYELDTYTGQQATPAYRTEFLRSLEDFDALRWWLAPSTGIVHTRLPCPACGWAEKRAEQTRLVRVGGDGAIFTAVCYEHGDYEMCIDPVDGGYLDLATLYRNVIKERALVRERSVLYVMVKGGDWAFGCQLVDGALLALATPAADMPARIFTPHGLIRIRRQALQEPAPRRARQPRPRRHRGLDARGRGMARHYRQLRRCPDLAGRRSPGRPQALLPILHHHRARTPDGPAPRRTRHPRTSPRDADL